MGNINLYLDDAIHNGLRELAKKKRMPVAALIRLAIIEQYDFLAETKREPTKLEKQVLRVMSLLISIAGKEKKPTAHFSLSYEQELQLRIGRWWHECKQAVSTTCTCLDRYFSNKGVSVVYDEDIYHLPHYLEPKRTVTTKEGFIIHFLQNSDDYRVSYQELLDAKEFIEQKIQEGGLFKLVNGES